MHNTLLNPRKKGVESTKSHVYSQCFSSVTWNKNQDISLEIQGLGVHPFILLSAFT